MNSMRSVLPSVRVRCQIARWQIRPRLLGLILPGLLGSSPKPSAAQVTYQVFPGHQSNSVSASLLRAQPETRVSLFVRDSTLKYVLRALGKQAHLQVGLDDGAPIMKKRVTLKVTNMPVMDAMTVALRGTGLVAKLSSEGTMIMIGSPGGLSKRSGASGGVAGRVTDSASGKGVSGATVMVVGTKLSTLTNGSGEFLLWDVPVGAQVVTVKSFGYKPASRTVTIVDSGRVTVRFVLTPTATVLSGVVTMATGQQRKIAVGNDITTINVDSVMRVAPITSVTDLLETRVPGLTVLHSSGTPGDPSRIRLRGTSSITGNNDPIVIVDGVRVYASQSDSRNANLAPVHIGGSGSITGTGSARYAVPSPLDQIDPNSIETIEVFKGPSASALYGSDAANGVIVITTKHGTSGKTHWQMALGAGLSFEPGDWPVNYYRFGFGTSSSVGSPLCVWYDLSCTVDSVVGFQALNKSQYTLFADHGGSQNLALSISGGVPTVQWALTGTVTNDKGILQMPGLEQQRFRDVYGQSPSAWMVRPDNYGTYGGSGQLTVKASANTSVTVSSSLYHSTQQRSSLEQAILQLEGAYINPLVLGTSALISGEFERATDTQLSGTNALTLRWQPKPWLPLIATMGLNTNQRVDNTYIPYGINSATTAVAVDTTGHYGLGHGTSMDKTGSIGTSIPLRIVSLALGGNYHAGSTSDFSAYTNDLSPGVTTPTTFPDTSSGFSQSSLATATYGWYVEPRLNIQSRMFLSPGFRLDGGSASGANAGLTGFPKIDFSWVAVDESNPFGPLTLLRPRVAFGYAGTQPSPTAKLRLFNSGGGATSLVNLNGTLSPAVFLTSLGNTQLRPETSRELEGGLDASLWNGRLQVTASLYNKTRYNAIISIPVAASVYSFGNTTIQYNIGEVRNTGSELTLQASVLQRRAVSWNIGVNMSTNDNLLVHLNPGANSNLGVSAGSDAIVRNVPGYPLFSQWAYPILSYSDANSDGVIEASEIRYGDSLVYIGRADPKQEWNLNTDITLWNGRISVHATLAYQNGMTQFNGVGLNSGAYDLLGNTPGISLATQAALTAAESNRSVIGVLQTVNTLRFQDFSINFAVPSSVSRRFGVPRMGVALQGQNLGLHSNYRGMDPDVNAVSTGNSTYDNGQLPQPRTWTLKLSLGD